MQQQRAAAGVVRGAGRRHARGGYDGLGAGEAEGGGCQSKVEDKDTLPAGRSAGGKWANELG